MTGKSSVWSPRNDLSNTNTSRSASMGIDASAERWTCVELLGAERDTRKRRTGWKRGERDDQTRGGGERWKRVEMDEVSVWSAESRLILVKKKCAQLH